MNGNEDDPVDPVNSDEPPGVTFARDDRTAATEQIFNFYKKSPPHFGSSDILALDLATPPARAAMCCAILCAFADGDGQPVFQTCLVISQPETNLEDWSAEFWTQFKNSFADLAGRPIDEANERAVRECVKIEAAPGLRSSTIADLIAGQPDRTAILICNVSAYRDDDVEPYIAPGLATPLQEEDFWAPQVHALAARVTAAIRDRQLYVAFDVGQSYPQREALHDLLLSIDNCGVMASGSEESAEHIFAQNVDTWVKWIEAGKLGRAIQAVDALPPKMDRHKAVLRIQLMGRAGLAGNALPLIREELATDKSLDPPIRVKLARIAQQASASRLAAEILEPAIAELDNREYLETAFNTACEIRDPALEEKVALRIEALFPKSDSVTRRRFRRLVEARKFGEAADYARGELDDAAKADFYAALDRHLGIATVPDYAALIAEAGQDNALSDAYRMAAVEDARSRGLPVHALDLATPLPTTAAQIERGELALVEVLQDLTLLAGGRGTWPVARERFEEALLALIKRLADDPAKNGLRIALAELLDPAISGLGGLALLVGTVQQLAGKPVRALRSKKLGSQSMTWLHDNKKFLVDLFEWMKSEEPLILGRTVVPPELLTEPADDIVSAISDYLDFSPAGTPSDDKALQTYLLLASAIVPHSSDPDFDLEILRLVTGKLASSGAPQSARDLVEQALINGAGTPRRRRLAWFAMADTYARMSNLTEAMLALACALSADDEADDKQIYQEISTLARLLRECGLLDDALGAVDHARKLLEAMGLTETFGHQLDTLALQIRHKAVLTAHHAEAIAPLLSDVVANAKEVLAQNALPAPVAAMLGQLLRQARLGGVPIPPDADTIFARLVDRTQGGLRKLLSAMIEDAPTGQDALELVRTVDRPRYSADVGYDMRNIGIVASRALSNDAILEKPVEVSLLLDLLADLGVAIPDWDEAALPPPLPDSIESTSRIAADISRTGISVVQAGFDDDGRLVRVSTIDGNPQPVIREPDEIMNEVRFKAWAKDFPFDYGIDEDSANLFYTTTADLRFSSLPQGPTVLVTETGLQSFPPNLLFVDDEFAGRSRPMAAAPSLAWLGEARKAGNIGDGRHCAWISTAVGEGSQTLPMIAQRLEGCFADFDFIVDNGPTLPAAFAGATLAVVTAHGGVNAEGRYFQMVSDEGVLRVTAGELANALRNIGIVILFVCSGGRTDKHPGANTTIGLAKQILDRGCTAVVASPWPLDARVPSHWLPAFLEHWKAGKRLIDACFEANRVVDSRFAQDPARGLAMTLFGNPEILHVKMDD